MSEAASLRLDGVALALDGRPLFRPLSLTVAPGEIVAVMGPSGSGKSSLLLHLCGLLPRRFVAAGRIHLGEHDLESLAPESRHLGLVLQDAVLFPHLSVGENLAFALPRKGEEGVRRRGDRARVVAAALAEAQLSGFAGRDPATLSGGQRARVALIRTLLAGSRALLLDEPFGALDRPLRAEIRGFVAEQVARRRLPTLLVTHDQEDADSLASRRVTLAMDATAL